MWCEFVCAHAHARMCLEGRVKKGTSGILINKKIGVMTR